MLINTGAPLVQWITYVLLWGNLASWIYLFLLRRWDRDLIAPILLVILHVFIFYTCILFFFYPIFSFTAWSQWIRLHTWATALLVCIALIIRRKKVERLHVR